jgi:hypothetical protein
MTSSVTLTGSGVSLLGVGVALGGADVPLGTLSISPPLPPTATASSTIDVTGVYAVIAPTGLTGRWNAGNISATVTNFAILSNNVWSATFSTPVAGTYRLTITGTGPNTGTATSGPVVIS